MAARRSRRSGRSKANREFVSEAEELLESLRSDLGDLQERRAAGHDEADPEVVNRLFRSAHSLKGLAGMFGFDGIGELAHRTEDVLDGLRMGRVPLSSPAVLLLDEVLRLFHSALAHASGAARNGDLEPLEDGAIEALEARLEEAMQSPVASPGAGFEGLDLDPALLRALTEYEEHRLRESLARGRHILMLDSVFEIAAFEEGLSELSTAVREVGEVISTLPSPGDVPESQIRFSLLVATDVDASALRTRLDRPDVEVRSLGGASQPAALATSNEAESTPEAMGSADIDSLKSISDTIRVDIRKLDELMNLVGELVIQRSALARTVARLQSRPETARAGAELSKVHKQIERKLSELQAGVLDVRMVPLRQVFEKVSRVVRRLQRDLGKQVRLEYRGAETELDKLIVEELVDPLMHLVRNAFDHAIESEAERAAAVKPAEGAIRIEAAQRGNHVVIQVSDDGRGIDPVALRTRAEAAGLVSAEDELTAKEVLDLVFAPGFSTRDEVSETSGRGVGMDVVRSNLNALGGIVDVESQLGAGTTVTMTLPITLAIIQALLVSVDQQRFAIPLSAVQETLVAEPGDVQTSEGREILNLRGDALPLRRLSREFELRESEDEKGFVVVLALGDLRLGLLVDRLDGQCDAVIKPIQGPVQTIRGIAGATELGDEGAVLVIDVSSIVEDAFRRREAA